MAPLFTDDSMLRTVHREWVVALSGPRALLMHWALSDGGDGAL